VDHDLPLPPPARRTPLIALGAVALLTVAVVAYVAQRPLTARSPRHRAGAHALFGTVNGVVLLTAAALPLAALAVWILARRRLGTRSAWRDSLADVGIVYGTLPWVWMTMLPGGEADGAPRRVDLVPLRDLFAVLASGPATATVQVGGNLLVFAAFGFFAPLRFAALASVRRVLALAAAFSALIETAQYVLRLGRVSSVDDVLLNAAGAALAALASRRWWHRRAGNTAPEKPR
jgi:hypothetical protein